jgi:hypothetical protein
MEQGLREHGFGPWAHDGVCIGSGKKRLSVAGTRLTSKPRMQLQQAAMPDRAAGRQRSGGHSDGVGIDAEVTIEVDNRARLSKMLSEAS